MLLSNSRLTVSKQPFTNLDLCNTVAKSIWFNQWVPQTSATDRTLDALWGTGLKLWHVSVFERSDATVLISLDQNCDIVGHLKKAQLRKSVTGVRFSL